MVRPLVHRYRLAIGGKKMMRAALPAVYVVAAWAMLAALVMCGPAAKAVTVTNSYSGSSTSVTITYNSSDGKLYWTRNFVAGGGGWAPGGWLHLVSGSGVTSGTTIWDVSPPSSTSASGSFSVTPGQWYMAAARVSGPGSWWLVNPDQYVWLQIPVVPCQAVMPALTNTTAYPIHYRIQHSLDGVVATVIVNPGESVPQSAYEVSCGGTYTIQWQVPDAPSSSNGDGTWTVVDDPADADPDGWNTPAESTPDAPTGDPDAETPVAPVVADADGNPLPPPVQPPAPPWQPTTPSTTDADRLDKQTFKQGADKIVGELQAQTNVLKQIAEVNEHVLDGDMDDEPDVLEPSSTAVTQPTGPTAAALGITTSNIPTFFGGTSMSPTSSITATVPGFTVAGKTWPSKSVTMDFSPYETIIGIVRNLLACIISIFFFIKYVETVKKAFV